MTPNDNVDFNNDSFSLLNDKAKELVLYSTTDTTWNVMTFTILNNTGVDLLLKGGQPVNVVQPGAASSFVFDFLDSLTDAQARVMSVSVKASLGQWEARYFPPTTEFNPTWAMAPRQDLTFKNGDQIVFTLANIACTYQKPSTYFDVNYFNIPGVNETSFPFPYLVSVLNPPVGKDLKKVLDSGVLNGSIVHPIGNQAPPPPGGSGLPIEVDITYDNNFLIQNGFTLYLKNNDRQNPLIPTNIPLGGAEFSISFLFASGAKANNAITTQALGNGISIAIDTTSDWSTTAHQPNTADWIFNPKTPGIMAANETVKFVVSNLITDPSFKPQTLSALHIQWKFIPGYADDYYSIDLQKQTANPSIPSSTIVPTTINLGQNVQISYQTQVAAYITLEYERRDGSPVKLVSPNDITYNQTNFSPPTAPDKEQTVFTLSVYRGPGKPVVQQKPFPITVNQPPAKINSFTASSTLVDITKGNQVTLNWTVENAKTVTLVGYGIQTGNSCQVTLNNTTTYTLQVTPWGSNGQVVQATITVYAYKSFSPVSVGPMGDGTAFQALPLTITNHAKGTIYVSNSAAGQVFQVNQANRQVLPTRFSGIIMGLTADEQKLFVAEWTGSPANMIRMYDTGSQSQVSSAQQPGPPPYSLAINPAGTQMYYLWRNQLTTVSAYTVNESGNTFSPNPVATIGVGTSPQAYVFNSTGTNLYIGNYKSGNVSVIRLSDNTVVATIGLDDGSQPGAFALVGTILFVAGSGGNQVYVIDTTNNTKLSSITVGYQPFSLTLDQNKARLFVTNFQDSTVTVIDTASKTVKATIPVGKGPSAIKITDSGNLMFVSNYCDKSLTVVDISNNGAVVVGTIQMETTNGNPVDISTYPKDNFYTDVFVAKEYFKGRNNACSTSSATDQTLNMSIFSIQEKASSFEPDAAESAHEVSRKRR